MNYKTKYPPILVVYNHDTQTSAFAYSTFTMPVGTSCIQNRLDKIPTDRNPRRVVIMKSERRGKVQSKTNNWLTVEMDDSPIIEVVLEDEICDEEAWDSIETAKPDKTPLIVLLVILSLILAIFVALAYTKQKTENTIEHRSIDSRPGERSTEWQHQ